MLYFSILISISLISSEFLLEFALVFNLLIFNCNDSRATIIALRTATIISKIIFSYIDEMEIIKVCRKVVIVDITIIEIFIFLFFPFNIHKI